MYSLIQLRRLVPFVLVCLALLPLIYAQDSPRLRAPIAPRERPVAPAPRLLGHEESPLVPPPDGVFGGSTAEGYEALFALPTPPPNGNAFDTGIGWRSLYSVLSATPDTSFNTGVGAGTLALNTGGENTATGAGALLLNTEPAGSPKVSGNTANGAFALVWNHASVFNTAVGDRALQNNDNPGPGGTANFNDAVGAHALFSNVAGFSNNALGESALLFNVNTSQNTAVGDLALAFNNTGDPSNFANYNTAVGAQALALNGSGSDNDAVGFGALLGNITGFQNVAMGSLALGTPTAGTASFNVALGFLAEQFDDGFFNTVVGYQAGPNLTAGIDNIYIGDTIGLFGVSATETNTIRIGDVSGFNAATACFIGGIAGNLQPIGGPVHQVTVGPDGKLGYDLGPNKPRARSQHQAMLNNKVEKLQATVTQQQKQIETLTAQLREQAAQIQKVSAQVEMIKPAPRVVENR